MSFKVHRITKYAYKIDGRAGMPSGMQLFSPDGKQRLAVGVVADSVSVPAPSIASDLESGTCWVRASAFAIVLDMLRNEDPVSVTLNDQSPGFLFIHTGIEPVGVGDEAAEAGTGYMPP